MSLDNELNWIVKEAIQQGVYHTYKRIEQSLPSCKPYLFMDTLMYEDCLLEKANHSLEVAKSLERKYK